MYLYVDNLQPIKAGCSLQLSTIKVVGSSSTPLFQKIIDTEKEMNL